MSFGVTPTGFVGKPLADQLTEFEAGWRAIFGNDVDLSPDTPDGEVLALVAAALDEAWQVGEATYFSYRLRQAVGTALSDLVALIGLSRLLGTPTTVTAVVNTPGALILANLTSSFRIESEAGDLFRPVTPGTAGDTAVRTFQSVENAALIVSPTETWKVVTPVANLQGIVSNATPPVIGTNDESDAVLRARALLSTENGATNILESLYSALLQVAGVSRVRVYVNATNGTVDGRPPHSYEVVIVGGADADIANAIWQNHPAGIEVFGTTTEVIVDSQGFNQSMEFTRPTLIPIIIDIVTSSTPEYPSTGDDEMKQAILDYAAGLLVEGEQFGIGDDVLLSRLYTALNSIPGHNVTALQIGAPGLGTADLVIDEDEIADFQLVNITVTS